MNKSKRFSFDLSRYVMIIAIIVIAMMFTFLSKGTFVSARNLSNLVRQTAFTLILAFGMFCVILLGNIDLSPGALVSLCGSVFGILTVKMGVDFWIAILLTVLLAVFAGVWNGYWVAYRGIPAFIATLASQLVFKGIMVGITGGMMIAPLDEKLQWLGNGYIPASIGVIIGAFISVLLIASQWNERRKTIRYGLNPRSIPATIGTNVLTVVLIGGFVTVMNAYSGVPNAVYMLALLFAGFYYLTQKTVFGRRMYAIGGNLQASILTGINVKMATVIVYGLMGMVSAFASFYLCGRLNAASTTAGNNAELDAIASCVIGGVSMAGGVGSLVGVVLGAIIISSIDNGLALLNTPSYWQTIIKGAVLLAAVWFDISKKRK